ncbi:MAG: hypothetical protein U0984_09815 [Prosthecobacter sp.]|nr:hypothetical protein [Prosthecobacter sp.]
MLLAALLAALAWPAYEKVRQSAHEAKLRQLDALKPAGPLSAEQKEAVKEFGERLARALTGGDVDKVATMVDFEAVADRALIPLGEGTDSAQTRKELIDGYRGKHGGLFAALLGNPVKYLRLGERDGFPAVRLRLMAREGTVNYVDVLVRVDEKGKVNVVDFFTFLFGTYATTESRNATLGIPGDDPARFEAMSKMATALRLGRGEDVVSQYQRLPAALKNERTFFMMYLRALTSLPTASAEVEKHYRQALADAPRLLGKESATDLLRVELHFLDGDFAGAEESLRHLEALVGPDPYLTQMRALMLLRQGKVDEAQRLEKEASAAEPDLPNLMDLRMMIYAAKKDYGALVNELRAYKTKNQMVISRQQLADPEYEAFLKSPEFATWESENR